LKKIETGGILVITRKKNYLGLFRLITLGFALFAVITQLFVLKTNDGPIDVLLYFTIQSNIFVILFLGFEIYNDFLPGGRVPIASPLQGGVTLYILITGLVYNLLLAGTWDPQGLELVVNTITHTVVPGLFLLDWLLSQKGKTYRKRMVGFWMIYPVLYLIFGSIEGIITGEFRYFFLDFQSQSALAYTLNLGIVLAAFLLVGVVLILLNKMYPSKK